MLSKEDIARVKGRGFLINRGTQCFSGRVVSPGGVFSAEQLRRVADCAARFGSGQVSFTSRLSAEIPGIPYDKIDAAADFIAESGLCIGGTGPKVRPVSACKGTVCVYGNIDTQALAAELHERFYLGMRDVKLPHKFKIGVGGCPNSCMKPSLNDLGIEGHRVIRFDADACRGCKICAAAAACPSGAVVREEGRMRLDDDKCLSCGVCVGKCPFGALPKQAEARCRIYVGGTWGRHWQVGRALDEMAAIEDVPALVEKTILWYRENGFVKERFAATLARVGLDAFKAALAGDDLIARREAILGAPLRTRG